MKYNEINLEIWIKAHKLLQPGRTVYASSLLLLFVVFIFFTCFP